MALQTIQGSDPYPVYLYHKDHDTPVRVDQLSEETPLLNQGWGRGYIHKEYPKMAYGKTED